MSFNSVWYTLIQSRKISTSAMSYDQKFIELHKAEMFPYNIRPKVSTTSNLYQNLIEIQPREIFLKFQ
jgi:hypothetical protein